MALSATERRLALYGTDEPIPRLRTLRAGHLCCRVSAGAVQSVHWQGTEVLRGVAYLLRDTDWGTVPVQVRGLQVQTSVDGFLLQAKLRMRHAGATLQAQLSLEGTSDGQLNLSVDAVADRPMLTNRCGLVLLHPANCAGLSLQVTHGDRPPSETHFPQLIQPSQPVFDIRALRWSPRSDLQVDCRLDAELPGLPNASFEMEDQRNWSDASFKTYVGSLRDPWPYVLPAGVRLRQQLQLHVRDLRSAPESTPVPGHVARPALRIGAVTGRRMPPLGLGMPHLEQPPSAVEQQAVVSLCPAWLVVQAELGRADLMAHLQRAAALAAMCGAQVQLDVVCPAGLSPDDCAGRIQAACAGAACQPSAVRLCPSVYLHSYQPDGPWPDVPPLETFSQAAAKAFPDARIGGGMVTFFTELNRKRPPASGLHFIGHSTCPTVHSADDAAVMQTLETLPAMAASVRACWPTLGWRLGPTSLGTLRNPYGEAPADNPGLRRIPLARVDPRHQGQFGAAWCAGYAIVAAGLGVELVTLLDSHGPNGPLARGAAAHLPDAAWVPAWAWLRVFSSWRGAALHALHGLPDGVHGLASTCPASGAVRLLLVNTRATASAVRLDRPMRSAEPAVSAETTAPAFTALRLPGYGLANLVASPEALACLGVNQGKTA